jgi:hypothetical protein
VLEASLKAMAEELGVGLGKIAQPLRASLTGRRPHREFSTSWFCSARRKAWPVCVTTPPEMGGTKQRFFVQESLA